MTLDASDSPGGEVGEQLARVGDRMQALPRFALEAAAQELLDRGRRRSRQAGPVDLARQDRRQRVGHRVGGEEGAAGEHFVDHHAERPDVGAGIDRRAACLLRRHVGRGAEDDAELRSRARR